MTSIKYTISSFFLLIIIRSNVPNSLREVNFHAFYAITDLIDIYSAKAVLSNQTNFNVFDCAEICPNTFTFVAHKDCTCRCFIDLNYLADLEIPKDLIEETNLVGKTRESDKFLSVYRRNLKNNAHVQILLSFFKVVEKTNSRKCPPVRLWTWILCVLDVFLHVWFACLPNNLQSHYCFK